MKIYFSGSISSGRSDVEHYVRIVDALRARGHKVIAGEVVNSSLGDQGEALASRDIFERDLGWIEEVAGGGGVLVAEVSHPSTGVGYEIAAARYLFDLPVICLWSPRYTKRCTAMLAGDEQIELIEYEENDLEGVLERLSAVLDRLANKRPAGFV